MSRSLASMLALALALQACSAGIVTGAAKPRTGSTAAPAAIPASVAPGLSNPGAGSLPVAVAPSNAPRTPASAPPVAELLAKPTGNVRVLAGTVQLDSRYAVGSGGGSFISQNGSSVLAMGKLKLDAAGELISQDSGSIVAQGGGNVISHNGSAVLSHNGSAIVAAGGGNIVSQGGGNIVAQGGGNAITRTYGLFADDGSGQAPAAGMLIEATRLTDGSPISLGVDAKNQPVYAIYSNAEGKFQMYLPADVGSNLKLLVSAPGTDTRLKYEQLALGQDQNLQLDEANALASRYLLRAFQGKLVALLNAPSLTDPTFLNTVFGQVAADASFKSFVLNTAQQFRDEVAAHHVPKERYADLAAGCSAALLSFVQLDQLQIDPTNTQWDGPKDEKVIDAMRGIFAQMRVDVDRVLADPGFFDKQDYLIQANQHLDPGQSPWVIKKASDVGDFVSGTYFSSLDPDVMKKATVVFDSVATPDRKPTAYKQVDHLFAAATGAALALAAQFVSNPDAQKAVSNVIASYGQ